MIKLGQPLTIDDVLNLVFAHAKASIPKETSIKIEKTYESLVKISSSDTAYYGINTGFGALAEKKISSKDSENLQRNIILSHAVGVGEPLDFHSAKALMLLRLNTLIQGFSGASPTVIHHLFKLLDKNCAPLVPKKGSVGASGDLAPLAHLGLLLLGIGEAMIEGCVVSAKKALAHAEIPVLNLGVRDGLALINGTQAMTAVGLVAIKNARELLDLADINAASSLDALSGHLSPFDKRLHELKPHPGQKKVAQNIINATLGRKIKPLSNTKTQDPYSLRCVPQVHGASRDVLAHVEDVVHRELNSVTDNPLIFFNESEPQILSGGNFHGQAIAMALDYLAMAVAELANISERRIELLLNPHHSNGLPPFLIDNPGVNSGYMMLQVTASALINENKVLTHPASTDSIPTSANREDHVSMGMTAANKLMDVIANTKVVLAIELLASHQALDHRGAEPGEGVKKIHRALREVIAFRKEDGLYREDLDKALWWMSQKPNTELISGILNR